LTLRLGVEEARCLAYETSASKIFKSFHRDPVKITTQHSDQLLRLCTSFFGICLEAFASARFRAGAGWFCLADRPLNFRPRTVGNIVGAIAAQQFIEQHTERINVGCAGHRIAADLFRTRVFRRHQFCIYSTAQYVSETLATKHVLQGTYITNGNYNATVPAATYTPIDTALTVSCPGISGTCTIEADMWVDNYLAGGGSGNINAICLYLDGVQTALCPYEKMETPVDGTHVFSSAPEPVSGVTPGNHTVQTYYYAANGAFVEYHTTNYRVYKP